MSGSLPPSIGDIPAARDPPPVAPGLPNEFLLKALNLPADRKFILKLDQELAHFIAEAPELSLAFPPMNPYQRRLVHQVADYFGLLHTTEGTNATGATHVVVGKGLAAAIPDLRLTDLVEEEEPPPKTFKIMRRVAVPALTDRRVPTVASNGTEVPVAATEPSKDRRLMSLEEREAAYERARAAIFQEAEEEAAQAAGGHGGQPSTDPRPSPQDSRPRPPRRHDDVPRSEFTRNPYLRPPPTHNYQQYSHPRPPNGAYPPYGPPGHVPPLAHQAAAGYPYGGQPFAYHGYPGTPHGYAPGPLPGRAHPSTSPQTYVPDSFNPYPLASARRSPPPTSQSTLARPMVTPTSAAAEDFPTLSSSRPTAVPKAAASPAAANPWGARSHPFMTASRPSTAESANSPQRLLIRPGAASPGVLSTSTPPRTEAVVTPHPEPNEPTVDQLGALLTGQARLESDPSAHIRRPSAQPSPSPPDTALGKPIFTYDSASHEGVRDSDAPKTITHILQLANYDGRCPAPDTMAFAHGTLKRIRGTAGSTETFIVVFKSGAYAQQALAEYTDHPHFTLRPMKKMKKADWSEGTKKKQAGVSDMTLLSKITNDAISDNLRKRFQNADIYTYIGHVLISVNPFRDIGIYTDQVLQSYRGKNRLELAPHVFAIAEAAYRNMVGYKENQCVIISGESGAGKTEAAKKIMQYIAAVSGGGQNSSIQRVKDMVLATNPLLESFGCAKTLRNNNSSRHGKYLEIQFNANGEPVGANITNYLLEKGRVVSQIRMERSFHIFYQMCKAAPQHYKDNYGISGPENFVYIYQSGCLDVDTINDTSEYNDTIAAMNVIGLSAEEQDQIHRMLAAILWLGNAQFQENDDGKAFVTDSGVVDFIAYLLEVESELLNKVLTSRVIETQRGGRRGSTYEVPLNRVQATAVRDAYAKAIYERMFEWIVTRINAAMRPQTTPAYTVGVLDIYGFEIFDHNSFEQLCINYVNEKLQQIFIELTLKAEQEEYVREQIKWTPIDYFNNKIVCDLIEERRPPGVFAAMNDACAVAHADSGAADDSLIQRLAGCGRNPHFELRGQAFLIKHYAGDVTYEVTGMTDKNKDQLLKDLLDLNQGSQSRFLAELFPEQVDRDSKKRPPTAGDRIKKSANDLVTNLMRAQPSYIRCIKPNENKSPTEYDDQRVLHQVKYLGLCENIRVRRAGFAYRQTFEKFVERFYLLSPNTSYAGDYTWRGDARAGTAQILKDTNIAPEEWQLGTTKAFIRHPETLWALENMRERYWHNMASRIQRAWRAYVRHRNDCATRIQRCWRRNKHQMEWLRLRDLGHQLLAGRKERRRFSLLSMRRYFGDYLGVGTAAQGEGYQLRAACGTGPGERVLFSAKGQVLAPRAMRSSKPSPRTLVVTTAAVYLVLASLERRLLTYRVERKIALVALRGLSTSTLQDDWVVLHVTPGAGSGATKDDNVDVILSCMFKTELMTQLVTASGGSLAVNVQPQITYTKKATKTQVLKFIKNEQFPVRDQYKSHVVQIGSGQPPASQSDPPCPSKPSTRAVQPRYKPKPAGARPRGGGNGAGRPVPQPQPTSNVNGGMATGGGGRMAAPPPPAPPAPSAPPTHPTYRALYNFTATIDGGIDLVSDEVYEILEQHDNGWWLGRKNHTEGWVPSNYLEKVEVAPPPPPPPVAAPVPVQAPVLPSRPQVAARPAITPKPAIVPKPQATGSAGGRPSIPSKPGMAAGGQRQSVVNPRTYTSNDDNTSASAPAARANVSQMVSALSANPHFNRQGQRAGGMPAPSNGGAGGAGKPAIPPRPGAKPQIPARPRQV
ncbi:class II myosin [Tieghemiomyces parasiticus]|uniref:Class II myosin n=1 Tax=Tieghemiomyces parasiticus TaxID=78921 RepID=A0A9W8AME4_9FUNG|nr:class II myosin [Tieghemiomyces parasiticus]